MLTLLWLWAALAAVLLVTVIGRGHRGGALTLAYFLGLSLIHVPGALVYAGPDPGIGGAIETLIGFEATLVGLAAFTVGAWSAARFATPRVRARKVPLPRYNELCVPMMITGSVTYFIVLPVASFIPSATSIIACMASLLIIGFWLWFYDSIGSQSTRRTVSCLLLLPLLPLSTLITGGFLGYGIYWVIAIGSLIYVVSGRKLVWLASAPAVAVFALSLAVSYFEERSTIRDAVWHENATLSERFDRTLGIVDRLEIFDFDNPAHLKALDARLNQNFLVGTGIERHNAGLVDLEYGGTVKLWALIPRAIWADKPDVGGGGDVVTLFTGITFEQGTSVGAGQPLEFYINFGWSGIVSGFLIFGFVLMRLDNVLARSLQKGDLRKILLAGLPGLALLQPGGNLLELFVSTVAAVATAAAAHWILLLIGAVPLTRRRHVIPT